MSIAVVAAPGPALPERIRELIERFGPLPERFRQVPRLAAFGLLPWLMLLAVGQQTPWVVLDFTEFAALLSLDALLRRRSAAAVWAGGAVALLLAGDALADLACAGPGHAVLAAVVMACCVELPLAAVCLLLGREAIRSQP
ncbi:hypothetical protein ABTZ03_02590 [Kitasatospora sp. NPDC096077]|uniref:hypothetical protein n=1 Tax=Kitasatospora sp. NPDC096077 TaxID=3155544 RepID=UPI0033273371